MLHSATLLHTSILKSGLRAPMSFFDSTPIGRIMNRFSKDIDVIDTQLPRSLHSWVVCALSVMATIAVICYSTPMFLVVILPMSIIYFLVQVQLATFQPIFIFTIFPRRTQLVSSIFFSFFLEFPDWHLCCKLCVFLHMEWNIFHSLFTLTVCCLHFFMICVFVLTSENRTALLFCLFPASNN